MPGKPHKPMRSRRQWRYLYARGNTDPKFLKIAHDKAHATPGGKGTRYRRLPERS
jgi:hypothetical protein